MKNFKSMRTLLGLIPSILFFLLVSFLLNRCTENKNNLEKNLSDTKLKLKLLQIENEEIIRLACKNPLNSSKNNCEDILALSSLLNATNDNSAEIVSYPTSNYFTTPGKTKPFVADFENISIIMKDKTYKLTGCSMGIGIGYFDLNPTYLPSLIYCEYGDVGFVMRIFPGDNAGFVCDQWGDSNLSYINRIFEKPTKTCKTYKIEKNKPVRFKSDSIGIMDIKFIGNRQ